MANLKVLRTRINSVRSTRKITSAMKMVAAAKLRRAQESAEAARPYAERMARMMASLAGAFAGREDAPQLLAGNGKDHAHLLVVVTSDRGLCGSFNVGVVRATRRRVLELRDQGKEVKLLCLGRKGRDMLRREFGSMIVDTVLGIDKGFSFDTASDIAHKITCMFESGEFDVCTVVFNKFISVMNQDVTWQGLIPATTGGNDAGEPDDLGGAVYIFEPDEFEILEELLPQNMGVQIFRSLMESQASEHAARMTAMDNATRNAGDMIDRLNLIYNRTRQAAITTEITEIVSGAEAL
ncbi:MAG: F0F1 ATP synthase subunit gamma [Rhodospirillales bacterium]|nr:F0F1 ATP synthase subunit gamma [Rhodospirillales bacterium]